MRFIGLRAKLLIETKLGPYLLSLKEQFTKYYLQDISELTGSHTVRIYELVRQYVNSEYRRRTIGLTEFKATLGVEKKHLMVNDFFKRVLVPAHREICAKTNSSFKYRPVKESRKFVAIEFYDIRQKKPECESPTNTTCG